MKQPILVIDNYDSFTYNLVHYLIDLGFAVAVYRNDKISLEDIDAYSHIVLSPGPGIPEEAGLLKQIIERYGPEKHIFGVCLGMQAIGEVYGGSLINLDRVYHGTATSIKVKSEDPIFKGLPEEIEVGRYHSWVVHPELPEELIPTSVDSNGQIMSLNHREHSVFGVQFHPESVLTPHGKQMISNWLNHTAA